MVLLEERDLMPTPEDVFRHRLRQLREQRGLSQAALATALTERGVTAYASTIAKMESRDAVKPRVIRLNEACAAAEILGVSLADMLKPDESDPWLVWILTEELSAEIGRLNADVLRKKAKLKRLHASPAAEWADLSTVGVDSEDGSRDVEHHEKA